MLRIKDKYRKERTFKKKDTRYIKKIMIKKFLNYLRKELQDSTAHGLPYVVNTKILWFERLFWAVSYLFANGLIFVLLSSHYIRFVQTPHVTSVEKDYFIWNVSYPSIVLCPKNKVDEESLITLVNETMLRTGKNLEQYLRSITSVSLDTLYSLQVPNEDIISLLNPDDYAKICRELFKTFDNTSLTTVTKWPITIEEAMTELGMCHVINSNVAIFDNPSKWTNSGFSYQKNNIELTFHDRDFFVQIMNYTDEYKIYTSSPDDIILSGTSSITFNNDGFLSFGVHIKTTRTTSDIRLMPLSLRRCRFLDEPNSDRYPIYSYNRCLTECRIKMIRKLCGCIPHLYKPLKNEKVCNLIELSCILNYNRDIMTLSASNETMEQFNDSSDIPRNSRDCGCFEDCEADVYQNDNAIFLPQESSNRLRITVASFPKVKFIRQIIFSLYDIFLKGGGIVNLCTGNSIITIMELILLVLRIPIYEIVRNISCKKFTRVTTIKNICNTKAKTK